MVSIWAYLKGARQRHFPFHVKDSNTITLLQEGSLQSSFFISLSSRSRLLRALRLHSKPGHIQLDVFINMLHSNSTTSDISNRSGPLSGWAKTICTTQDPSTLSSVKLIAFACLTLLPLTELVFIRLLLQHLNLLHLVLWLSFAFCFQLSFLLLCIYWLHRKICCFNHSMVTLVADKLKKHWLGYPLKLRKHW